LTSSVACVWRNWWRVHDTPAVLLGPEQWPVAVSSLLQVGPELTDQGRIIQQHRPPLPALAKYVHVFVVGRQVQILQVHTQRLGDSQARLEDEAKEETVPPLSRRDRLQDRFHWPTSQGPRAGWAIP
jgi:hypothetical protein